MVWEVSVACCGPLAGSLAMEVFILSLVLFQSYINTYVHVYMLETMGEGQRDENNLIFLSQCGLREDITCWNNLLFFPPPVSRRLRWYGLSVWKVHQCNLDWKVPPILILWKKSKAQPPSKHKHVCISFQFLLLMLLLKNYTKHILFLKFF